MTWTFSFGGEMIYTVAPPYREDWYRDVAVIAIEDYIQNNCNEIRNMPANAAKVTNFKLVTTGI
jgi:hypothetical protein